MWRSKKSFPTSVQPWLLKDHKCPLMKCPLPSTQAWSQHIQSMTANSNQHSQVCIVLLDLTEYMLPYLQKAPFFQPLLHRHNFVIGIFPVISHHRSYSIGTDLCPSKFTLQSPLPFLKSHYLNQLDCQYQSEVGKLVLYLSLCTQVLPIPQQKMLFPQTLFRDWGYLYHS